MKCYLLQKIFLVMLLVFLGLSIPAIGAVSQGLSDVNTQSNWRTGATLEEDGEYGTDGYLIFGLNPPDGTWLAGYDTSTSNGNSAVSLPVYIDDIVLVANNSGMWSGNGNFGQIEDPTNGNALTSTPVIAWGSDPYEFTISRSGSNGFRLTIIYATGDGQTPTWTTTVNDGSGSLTKTIKALASPNIVYHLFDISGGSGDISVSISADSVDGWITGFAFDPVEGLNPSGSPEPVHEQEDVLPTVLFKWEPSPDAVSQEVYFGTEPGNLDLLKTLGGEDNSCQPVPSPLKLGQTYNWRVDTIADGETIEGGVWKFTTRMPGNLDLDLNGAVDVGDLEIFAQRWLGEDCLQDNWCSGADIDFDGRVGMGDFSRLAAGWGDENPQDIIFDFETGDLQGWRIVDGGFGKFICDRATFHNGGQPYNKQGTWYISSLETEGYTPNDAYTGVAESPVFRLTEPDITFLVGGGDSSSDNYIAICTVDEDLNEQEIRRAYGIDSETMQRVDWSFPELVGKKVFVRLADKSTGGWGHVTFDDFAATGIIDKALTSRRWLNTPLPIDIGSARAAVEDLMETYPPQEYDGQGYLNQLDDYAEQLRIVLAAIEDGSGTQQQLDSLIAEVEAYLRQVLIANPLVSGQPILFIMRDQYPGDHHNTHTFFPSYDNEMNNGYFRTGGAMKTVDFGNGGKVTTLVETPSGMVRDPDVYFDGRKIVFAKRDSGSDNYNIYEINSDGTGLVQLTTVDRVTDLDPIYMPNDSIVFSSTREPKFVHCNRHIQCNLYRMEADGANIHQISKNTLFDFQCSLMPDGRVMYSRWEYVDRNFGDAESIWTCNPDGTKHAHYFGNNTISPGAVLDPRVIPGTHWMIGIFGSCHDRPWGALAIVDRRLGVDLPQPGKPNPVKYIWPESSIDLFGGWDGNRTIPTPYEGKYGFDNTTGLSPKYEDPFPLSDKYFLVSRTISGERTGIFLLDVFGNEILLHGESNGKGCYDPMPLSPRQRPPQIPTLRKFSEDTPGYFYVSDVYHGTHMEGVERGSAKYLRIVEATTKKTWTNPGWSGQGFEGPGMAWHDFYSKKILGTVPVEEDGSVHFEVPSETFVYFQLLDEDGKMIQSMRSGTYVQPGERVGCVGCHEPRTESMPVAPDDYYLPVASQKPAETMTGWYGETKNYNFLDDVQPVFSAKCASCHGFDSAGGAAGGLLLEPDKTIYFNSSYNELWRKGYTGVVGAGPAPIQQAYSWGSHASRLVSALDDANHSGVILNEEEYDRIVTWIDLNAPYYPDYTSAYPNNAAGRSPLSGGQLNSLSSLTGFNFGQKRSPALSFDRPEKSLCLQSLSGSVYEQALAIIVTGKSNLTMNPRADMPGHVPCAADQVRLEKYDMRKAIENLNRQAIREGWKNYD